MRKLLSVFMSFTLVFTLMPLPAHANLAPGSVGDLGASEAREGNAAEASEAPGISEPANGALAAQEAGDFDQEGELGEFEDANFRYWYTLTSVDAGNRTAKVYMMNFRQEDGDEDGDGRENESLFPSGGNGSIDWVIPSQLVSERGNAYTITEFDADPTNGAADLDHPDGSGTYPTYKPIQFVRSITVPASIESIAPVGERSSMNMQWSHSSAFDHVKSITFEEGSKVKELPACFAHQLWFLDDVTLPAGLEEIGTCAFWECFSLGDITLPSSLKAIGKMAFADTNLGAVAFPDGLETIGDGAFAWYDYLPTQFGDTDEMQALAKSKFMTEVVIPGSVKTIGAYAFVQKGNTSINGPASGLDYRAWWQGDVDAANDTRAGLSRIASIQLGEGVEEIGAGAFAGSRVAEVTIPASVRSIGQGAFAVSDIAAVNWTDSENSQLETLSGFNDCAWLSSIDIPQSVTAIGEWAFQNSTGLTSIFIPANVASIERGAFQSAGIQSLLIASGSVPLQIRTFAFRWCTGLSGSTIVLPKRVSAIGSRVFEDIANATYKVYNDELMLWDEDETSYTRGIGVPASYPTEADLARWGHSESEDADTMYLYFADSWQKDDYPFGYDTSDPYNYMPLVDVRNSIVYYPDTLTHETSLSLWAYADDAQKRRAVFDDPATDHWKLMFNAPRFIPFDASGEAIQEEVVDARGGEGLIEVLTGGTAGSDARVCVFDAAGKLAGSGQAYEGYAGIEGIVDGTYTVVAFANNARFTTIGSEDDLAAMGVDASHYARAAGVAVAGGGSVEVSLSVPALAASTLGGVLESSAVNVGKTDVVMGTEVYAALSFTLKGGYNSDAVTMKVPAGLEVVSVYSKSWDYLASGSSSGASFNSSSRVLTVKLDNGKTLGSDGVHRLWVGLKPIQPGYYSVNASVTASGITVPAGAASFSSCALSLDVPAEPIDDDGSTFPITVHAAPGSYVKVVIGGKAFSVGPTNKNGSCTEDIAVSDILRDGSQPSGMAAAVRDFLVRASLKAGGVTYTDVGTVSFKRTGDPNVTLTDFSFIHAGAAYDIVKDGRRLLNSTYYTYVADGQAKNEYWTFSATFRGNQPLGTRATVQVQMLDGSSRYAPMQLVRQTHRVGSTDDWVALYAATIRIEQAGDHVFPASLVPCGFDAFYELDETAFKPNQADVNLLKYLTIRTDSPSSSANADEREKQALRELYPGLTDAEAERIASANPNIALFAGFVDHLAAVAGEQSGATITGEEALDYFADAVWEVAVEDESLRTDLEQASGTTIDTSDKPTGKRQVKKALVGDGTGAHPRGMLGDADDIAASMHDKGLTGMDKTPRQAGSLDKYLDQVKPDGPAPDLDDPGEGWDVFSDSDVENDLFKELGDMLDWIGTPEDGQLGSGLAAPSKFGVKVNPDADGYPESFELADSNGNHVKFNMPELARAMVKSYDKRDQIPGLLKDKLKESFQDYVRDKVDNPDLATRLLYDLSKRNAEIDLEMMRAIKAVEDGVTDAAAKAISDACGSWWDSEMRTLVAAKLAYDAVKERLSSWTWDDTKTALDDAQTKLKNAKAAAEQYAKKLGQGALDACKEAYEKLERAYDSLARNLSEKAAAEFADANMDSLWTVLDWAAQKGGTSEDRQMVKGARALWKYGVGGVQSLVGKVGSAIDNRIRNALQEQLQNCNPTRNARYQTSVVLDPSGAVYEAVGDNLVPGVTATVYEVSDPGNPVPWDAAEYDQVNPQTTGLDGTYGWNVPAGKWQVRFAKEGYADAATDVLPVPPPQMGLATPLFTTAKPQAVSASATTRYVDIVFDQYMNVNASGVVQVNGEVADPHPLWQDETLGTVKDGENGEVKENMLVSKVLRATLPADVGLGDKLTVKVGGVMSYSGLSIGFGDDDLITFENVEVRKQPTSIEFVSGVGEEAPLAVAVSDESGGGASNTGTGSAVVLVKSGGEPAAGVSVRVTLDNAELATVGAGGTFTGTTDFDGRLSIPLAGKLPGMSVLTATTDGGLSTQANLLTTFTDATQVARPVVKAGDRVLVGAGTAGEIWATVAPGTQLEFSCATEGATIYYTTDGTCPCDDTSADRREYAGPITVTESIALLRVRAMKDGLTMSENVSIHLTVADSTADKVALQAALDRASASPYTDSVQVSADGTDVYANAKWVTQAAKDALAAAKAQAAAVAADSTATQELVDEATANLNTAMAGYVPKAGAKELSPVFIQVAKPIAQSFTYDGTAKVGVASGAGYTLIGTTQATNPGTYTATAKLSSGYAWADGSAGDAVLTWSITAAKSTWKRLQGDFALDTMASIVREGWSGQAGGTVVLATFDGYWDALTAAGIAGMAGAPVLMTSGGSLSPQTAGLIAELRPATIVVCGGTAAVSQATADQAAAICGSRVERLSGQTATGTAVDLFEKAPALTGGSWSRTAFVCTNDGYWDALSAAPIAFAKNMPIFLTEGAGGISDETLSAMRGNVDRVYIVGGIAAVGDGVVARLQGAGIQVAGRLAGDTAIETSEAVASYGLALGMTCAHMGVATNGGYWDALSGAALCGKRNSVLVLAGGADSHSVGGFVASHSATIAGAYVFGGPAAVDDATLAALRRVTS